MVHSKILPNGLRVLTIPMASSETVTLMVMARGGSRYEERDISGLAHYMEHMFFKGGQRYPTAPDVSHAIDAIGGEFNAFTSYEEVAYYVKCAAEQLPVALDVVSDMLLNATVPTEEVERERNVILEEFNMTEDSPMDKIQENIQTLLYGDHPLGWRVIGTRATLAGADRAKLMSFREKFYRPENMIVVAAGKVEPDAFFKQVEAMLPLSGGAGVAQPVVFTEYGTERISLETKQTEQAQIALAMPGPRMEAADKSAVSVMTAIFGQGMSSRLFVSLRERQGLCYYVRASAQGYSDAGDVMISAGVTLDKIDQAIKAVLAEIELIRTGGVTDKEMIKGKNFLKGHLAIALEDTASMAQSIGGRALVTGKVETPEERFARLDAVTKDEVEAAARLYLDPAKVRLAVLGPYEDAERFRKLLP